MGLKEKNEAKDIESKSDTEGKKTKKISSGRKPIKNNYSEYFILDPNRSMQSINHALGTIKDSKGNSYRYYGIYAEQLIITTNEKGEEKEEHKILPAIVLENKQIISAKWPYGFHFKFDTIMSMKDRWSVEAVKNFLEGNQDITFQDVFVSFKKHHESMMVYECPEWYDYYPIWEILTYFHDIIDKAIISKREGPSGSAKSKGMKISANLSFNGRKWVKPTAANFFRYRHKNKSAIFLEEAEHLFADDRKKNSEDDAIVEYLNASYEKGNFVPRQDDKNKNLTLEFDPFGFTQIGSIKPLKGATLKRSITNYMVISKSADPRSNLEVPAEMNEEFQKSRDLMYACGLLHYREFQNKLNELQNKWSFANREWHMVKPILAMSDCIDKSEKLKEKLAIFLEKRFDVRDEPMDENRWESIIATILLQITCKKRDVCFISNEDIKNAFLQHPKVDPYQKITTNSITTIIKELGFGDNAGRDTTGVKRGFALSFCHVCQILNRNSKITVKEIIKKVSEVSECQFKEDEIQKMLSDNILTNNKMSDFSDNLTDLTLSQALEALLDKHKDGLDLSIFYSNIEKAGFKIVEAERLIESGLNSGILFSPRAGFIRRLE